MNILNSEEHKTIKVLIVDDQQIVRQTIKFYLEEEPDIKVIGCAENGAMALAQIEKLNPDVAIVDLEMPDIDGITTIKIISKRFPLLKALVLSGHDERSYINSAILAGAKGYLLKGTSARDLANTIRAVDKGYFQLGSGLLNKLSLELVERSQAINSQKNRHQPQLVAEKKQVSKPDNTRDSLTLIKSELSRKFKNQLNDRLKQVRQELINCWQEELTSIKLKQIENNTKIAKIQRNIYWLMASHLILFLIAIII